MRAGKSLASSSAAISGVVSHKLLAILAAGLLAASMTAQAEPFAYVTNTGQNNVSVIDVADNSVVATVAVGGAPLGVAITPDGAFAYVANRFPPNVSVIDTATNTVTATVSVGSEPVAVEITPNGNIAYVVNYSSANVSVIDTATHTVTATIPVGTGPSDIVIAPDGSAAYVTNQSSGTISIIDTATNTVTATVSVGGAPVGLAITPDGDSVYVARFGTTNVSVIDTATNAVAATVDVGSNPIAVAITPDGTSAYVTNWHSNSVAIIDITTNIVAANVNVGSNPWGITISPNGDFAYVVNFSSNNVSVIATATKTVAATVAVGSQPIDVAITPRALAKPFAYVANQNSNSVSVIDTTTNAVTTTVAVDSSPRGVAITPDGAFAYVAKRNVNTISVIDTATNTVTTTVAVGGGPFGVAITPDGAFAYVTNEFSNNVSVIDTATNTVTMTVAVGTNPFAVAITPDGDFAYVVNQNSANVSVIDTATNTVATTVMVGSDPRGIAITPDGASAYVVSLGPDNVSVIDTATNTVTATVAVGTNPFGVAITPDGTIAYVANSTTNNVSVIDTATNTVTTTVTVGSGPLAVAITPDGDFAYVTNSGSANVSVIDTATNTVTAMATVGTNPFGVAIALLVADATPPVNDTTPPTIQIDVTGTLGDAGWYVSDVQIRWTVVDAESAISTSTGCDLTHVAGDTAGVTLTCTATSDGGTASENVTIKRDETPPAVVATASPMPNGNGWNNTNVTVTYTGSDAISGVLSCDPPELLSTEGLNVSVHWGSCRDNAGNVSSPATPFAIHIDKTPPIVTTAAAPPPNGAGWNSTAVTVSFIGLDALSGVAVGACDMPILVSSNGTGQSVAGRCVDRAFNVGQATHTGLNIDTTPPVATASRTPAANAFGWNNTNVTASWAGTDALSGSGVSSCSSDFVFSAEGFNQSTSGSCLDVAGLVSSLAEITGVSIDKTAPAVPSMFVPVPNDGFVIGETPAANYWCADSLSGIATCNGSVASGAAIDTSVLGTNLFIVTATDRAGNIRAASDNYFVNSPNTVIITTVAGNGSSGFSGDGGAATSASFNNPTGVAVDAVGNLYISDADNSRIRRVSPGGIISTVAGNGTAGFSGDGGAATSASLNFPLGVAVDAAGNLYISDNRNHRVRRVTPGGIISTVAGNGTAGFSGNGGAATSASLNFPSGVAVDAAGNLYISDYGNHRIRRVTPGGIISTVAGNGTAGFSGDGGAATSASLNAPSDVSVDAAGNLYIAMQFNARIRRVTPGGIISTVAGNGTSSFSGDGGTATNAGLPASFSVAVDAAGNLFIRSLDRIRRVRDTTYTLAPMAVFGSQALNVSSVPQIVTLANGGPQPVSVTGITITGANAGQFSQTNNCGILTFEAVETTCTINVVFRPTSNGAKLGVLNVSTAGGSGTKSAALSGTGGPTYVLDPYAVAFGNQPVSLPTVARSVSVTNTGTLALPISSITINGTNGNQFSQTNNCGASVAAGAACTINVVFRPTTIGVKSANLNVNAGGGAGTKVASLIGTGTPPTYSLSTTSIAFNNQAVSVPNSTGTVILNNTGPIPVPITSVTDTGTNANQFSETHNCGASVAVGGSCTITVTFLPTSAGAKVATMNVNAGGGAGTQTVTLTGTGVVPAFSLDPTAIGFPPEPRGTTSKPWEVTVINTGSVQLAIVSVTRTGATPGQFAHESRCTAPVPVGGSCSISVFFSPTSAGNKSATLNVRAGGGAGTKTVALTGTGT